MQAAPTKRVAAAVRLPTMRQCGYPGLGSGWRGAGQSVSESRAGWTRVLVCGVKVNCAGTEDLSAFVSRNYLDWLN